MLNKNNKVILKYKNNKIRLANNNSGKSNNLLDINVPWISTNGHEFIFEVNKDIRIPYYVTNIKNKVALSRYLMIVL